MKRAEFGVQVDAMRLALSPVLGEGENLFSGINLHEWDFRWWKELREGATYVLLRKER